MRIKFSILFIITVLTLALSSCKQSTTPLALYIPKDAATVMEIDTKSITDKIQSSGITLDSLANMMDKNDHNMHWSDIENSGVDLNKPFFIFSSESSSMQNGNSKSSGVVAAVSDKNKLQRFLQKQAAGAAVKSDNKYQYIDLNDGSVAGWTNDVLIISDVNNNENTSHQQLTTLFTQSESNSVVSIDDFNKMLTKTGDIHFWSNASNSLNKIPMASMSKIGTLVQDTYTEGTIDFENGKVVANFESHFNKTLSDMLGKYPAKEIDKSMIANYPNPVNGFGIVAFNPKVLVDILHYLGFDMMIDNYASSIGFTTSDVMNAFSGDIAVMFSNFKMDDNGEPMPGMPMNKPGGEFLMNLKIGDKNAFDKVMNGLVNKGLLTKNGDQYQLGPSGGHKFVIETTNESLLIGSNDDLVKAYETGNSKNGLVSDVEKEMNDKSMVMYVNVASILQNANSSDTSAVKVNRAAQATFKSFIATTDKTDGKTASSNLELNTVNSNENSLASLVKFIAVAHEEGKLNHRNGWTKYPPLSGLKDSMQDQNMPQSDSGNNNR